MWPTELEDEIDSSALKSDEQEEDPKGIVLMKSKSHNASPSRASKTVERKHSWLQKELVTKDKMEKSIDNYR